MSDTPQIGHISFSPDYKSSLLPQPHTVADLRSRLAAERAELDRLIPELHALTAENEALKARVQLAEGLATALEEAHKFFSGGLESAGFNLNDSVERVQYMKILRRLQAMNTALAAWRAQPAAGRKP